jgi:hypothetical protein
MEPGNLLLNAAYTGDGHLHLVRPTQTGQVLAIGNEVDELETVTVLKAFPPGYVVQLEAPLKRFWRDGTPVGIIRAIDELGSTNC